jgi:hypothetical protein
VRITPTEVETQRAILEYLQVSGIFAGRLNTGGGRVDGRPVLSHSFGKGCADILAFVTLRRVIWKNDKAFGMDTKHECGRTEVIADSFIPLWIEVKSPTGKQSPEQKSFQEHVESLGHTYLLVRSIDEVLKWLKEIA